MTIWSKVEFRKRKKNRPAKRNGEETSINTLPNLSGRGGLIRHSTVVERAALFVGRFGQAFSQVIGAGVVPFFGIKLAFQRFLQMSWLGVDQQLVGER